MRNERIKLLREDLYEQVWNIPMLRLAKEYGLSDVRLAKICRKMGIPLPGRGYWAKVGAGRVPPRPKLPSLKKGQVEVVMLASNSSVDIEPEEKTEVGRLVALEKEPDQYIEVLDELQDPLNLIEITAKSLQSAGANERHLVHPRAKSCLDIEVTKESIDRAMRVMDALCKGLEERGCEISTENEKKLTQVTVLDETLSIRIEERIQRIEHVRTPH